MAKRGHHSHMRHREMAAATYNHPLCSPPESVDDDYPIDVTDEELEQIGKGWTPKMIRQARAKRAAEGDESE